MHGLETRLTHFLEDLLEPLGRRERRHWARVYVQGLLLDGERKSIEPLAIAYAFLRAEQARLKKNCWCELEPAPGPQATTGPAHSA